MVRLVVFIFIFLSFDLHAAVGKIPLLTVSGSEGQESVYEANIYTLLFMSMLPFLTAAVIMLTPFMRAIIIFGFLRQALGTQHSPPNQVLIAISLMISIIVMKPVLSEVYKDAYKPYTQEILNEDQAIEVGLKHFKRFWLSVTSEEELIYFGEIMEVEAVDDYEDLPLEVILPAFVFSELTVAFKIAFLIFIPFLIIDMVVASTLMGMGMMMLSPMIISLPFKIFAFILLDGFGLVTSSVIGSYGV